MYLKGDTRVLSTLQDFQRIMNDVKAAEAAGATTDAAQQAMATVQQNPVTFGGGGLLIVGLAIFWLARRH